MLSRICASQKPSKSPHDLTHFNLHNWNSINPINCQTRKAFVKLIIFYDPFNICKLPFQVSSSGMGLCHDKDPVI